MSILSIGLNVRGAGRIGQLVRTLGALSGYKILQWQLVQGVWEGVPETTLHVEVAGMPLSPRIAALAVHLEQDAIAVYDAGDTWTLVYADGSVGRGGTMLEFPSPLWLIALQAK